ncbi:MAG: hypothetical protein AAF390_08815 [Pseudomonadota bacterium]
MTLGRILWTLFALVALSGGMARAACDDLRGLSAEAAARDDVAAVQRGVRTALADDDPRLRDGTLGSYTRAALARLCAAVPQGGAPVGPATFDLALEYDALTEWTGAVGDWRAILLGDDIAARLAAPDGVGDRALALRLAATPLMTAFALGDPTAPYACRGVGALLADAPAAEEMARALYPILGVASPSALCRALPVSGDGADFTAALVRLGGLEDALPGALADLADPRFGRWLAEGDPVRRLRLAGTPAAVLDLIAAYRSRSVPAGPDGDGDPCAPVFAPRTTTYFSLSQAEIDALELSLDLRPVLDSFAAEAPSFGSARQFWAALRAHLASEVEACLLDAIEAVVRDPARLGRSFRLDAAAATNLTADPDLQAAQPVIAEFLEVSAPTEAQLIAGIEAALTRARLAAADAEIEAAAEILAAAAEPVQPVNDTAAITADIPPPEEAPPPLSGVTDATALTLEQSLTNPDFLEALLDVDFLPATTPELLKGEVRSVLRPIAEEQGRQAVAREVARIAPTAVSSWSLTSDLRRAILAIPAIAEAQGDGSGRDLAARLREIAGLQYPSERLFRVALGTVPPARIGDVDVPLSERLAGKITGVAAKQVARPDAPRIAEGFALPDCGCVPWPGAQPEVYGFYPFWLAPPLDTEPSDDGAPAAPAPLDFGLVGRVAYYGLEFDFDDPALDPRLRSLTLRHGRHWAAAKRAFVNEAHRHRAKVDLSFDLRNWIQWTDRNVEQAVAEIAGQMAPFEKVPGYDVADLARALPTIFDTAQPDGLTLIFHGYESNRLTADEVDRMVDIVTSVYEALPGRDRLDINVAFDFGLVADDLDEGLFDELYDLLITQTVIVEEQARDAQGVPLPGATVETRRDTVQMVSRILLFLERRTSETKKSLRARMEQGLFQGATRANVLRSILPVLPPSGHEFVQPSQSPRRPADRRETFGQFEDDVIYFKDNFAGLAFWPVPAVDGPETAEIAGIVRAQFGEPPLPPVLASFEDGYRTACTWACPNRAYLALAGMAVFTLMALLTWRSFYSGRAEKVAFRILVFGMVGLMNAGLFAVLVLLTACDTDARVAPYLLAGFVALLAAVGIGRLVNRAQNGPMP